MPAKVADSPGPDLFSPEMRQRIEHAKRNVVGQQPFDGAREAKLSAPGLGDEGYVTELKAAQRAGHITQPEVVSLLGVHGSVMRRTLPVDEAETLAAIESLGGTWIEERAE